MLLGNEKLTQLLDQLYKRQLPIPYAKQLAAVEENASRWRLWKTSFTGVYVAKNFRTAYHRDGNLKGAMTAITAARQFHGRCIGLSEMARCHFLQNPVTSCSLTPKSCTAICRSRASAFRRRFTAGLGRQMRRVGLYLLKNIGLRVNYADFPMITLYRRHQKGCEHRGEGRKYRRCRCPLWVDGFLGEREIRKALGLRDWTKAQDIVREWELEGEPTTTDGPGTAEPISLEEAWRIFLSDQEARKLHSSTIRKYKLLRRKMQEFATQRGLRFLFEMEPQRSN